MKEIEKIEFKRQGKSKDVNGTVPAHDSWWIHYTDGEMELVYEDPTVEKKLDVSNVDLTTLTAEQLAQLKTALGL